jgi:hypothetical protein
MVVQLKLLGAENVFSKFCYEIYLTEEGLNELLKVNHIARFNDL